MITRKKTVEILAKAQNGLCASCGRRMLIFQRGVYFDNQTILASIDHLIPRNLGGGDDITNKVAMHRGCNSAKGNRMPTGCERIFHAVVLAKLDLTVFENVIDNGGATLGDIWPK